GGRADSGAHATRLRPPGAGGVQRGNRLGFGFTVVVDDLNRQTQAILGDTLDTAAGSVGTSTINVTGPIDVHAKNSGAIVAASYAAADIGPGLGAEDPLAPKNNTGK